MATLIRKWDEPISIPVINVHTGQQKTVFVNGKAHPLSRVVWNPPLPWIFPDWEDNWVFLDWEDAYRATRKKLIQDGQKGIRKALDAAMLDMLSKPVVYNGREYRALGHGSGVKNFQTLGLTRDYMREAGLVICVEDYCRVTRAIVPNCLYGGGVIKLKVKFVGVGTPVGNALTHDGCSVLSTSAYELIRNARMRIVLGQGAQSFHVAQQYKWNDGLLADVAYGAERMKREIGEVPLQFAATFGDISKYKWQLIAADPKMLHHPLFAAPLANNAHEVLNNMGTCIYSPGEYKVALPSLGERFVVDIGGKRILAIRWPIDAPSNIQAAELDPVADRGELERLRSIYAVVQHTTTCPEWSAKGLYTVTDIPENFGADIVMCVEDVKMVKGIFDIQEWRKSNIGKTVEIELFVGFTQAYGPESIAFVPVKTWKKMGGDVDGDPLLVVVVDEYPEMFRQAWEWRDKSNSAKVEKTRTTDFSLLPKFILSAWGNGIGFATNIYAGTFMYQDRSRVVKAIHSKVPKVFSFVTKKGLIPNEDNLDYVMNRIMKIFQDIFKTMVAEEEETTILAHQIQTALTTAIGGTLPHILWRNDEEAFRVIVPDLKSNRPDDQERARNDPEFRSSNSWRIHIDDRMLESTIIQIFLYMRPYIVEQFDRLKMNGEYSVTDALHTAPLSDFVSWAPAMPDTMIVSAKEMVDIHGQFCSATSYSSGDNIEIMDEAYRTIVDSWVNDEFGGDRKLAAFALWRAAHHSRSTMSGACAVFDGMPDEALWIVRTKPGVSGTRMVKVVDGGVEETANNYAVSIDELLRLNNGVVPNSGYVAVPSGTMKCIVTGIHKTFERMPKKIGPFMGAVIETGFGDKTRLMIVSHDKLPGQIGSANVPNDVGLVGRHDFKDEESGYGAPPPGQYVITIDQYEDTKRYMARLTPV